jgi:hypothetical protein
MSDKIKDGRPFKFTDPRELGLKIQNYFDYCDPHIEKRLVENGLNQKGDTIFMEREIMTEQIPYTVTGLALELGVSRSTLLNYKDPDHWENADITDEIRQELFVTIYAAFQKVEAYNERALHKNGISNGIKFNLTNNFGWVDKQVIDNNNKTVGETLDDLDDDSAQRENVADEAAKALEEDSDGAGSPTPE